MIPLEIKIHEIAVDGLPNKNDDSLINRYAFIFDGCIVSGWPISRGEYPDTDREMDRHRVNYLWSGNEDVAHGRLFGNVTHWVEFPITLGSATRLNIQDKPNFVSRILRCLLRVSEKH